MGFFMNIYINLINYLSMLDNELEKLIIGCSSNNPPDSARSNFSIFTNGSTTARNI